MADPERDHERDVEITALSVEDGDVSEYELAVEVNANLAGERGTVRVQRTYEALPRQNDTVDHDAVDTNDELLDDPAAVHVHTKYFAGDGVDGGDGTDGADDGGADGGDSVGEGAFLADRHSRWKPTDPSVLTDGESFTAACRVHFEETAGATYETGADALND